MDALNVVAPAGPRAALRIERLQFVLGSQRSVAQPSVQVLMRVSPPARSADTLLRFESEVNALLGTFTLDELACNDALVGLLARSAHALMRAQGMPVYCPPIAIRLERDAWRVTVPTITGQHPVVVQMVTHLVALANASLVGAPTGEITSRLRGVLKSIEQDGPKGKNTILILDAADRLGIPWSRLSGSIYRLGQGARSRWFNSTITDRTPATAVHLAKMKHEGAALLRRQNIPVAQHVLVYSEDEAVAAADRFGYPVVVKPANLDRGVGVASRLRDPSSVRRAYREAARHSKLILLEQHFHGEDHRIHVFEGEVFRVRHRIPGGVTGDGKSTVGELLAVLNADPRRGEPGSSADLIRIDLDDESRELLQERAMDASSVPAEGEFIQLRRIANVSVGGVSVSVPIDAVHPDNLALAVRAVAALRLDLAAVDFLIPDIRRSWLEVGAAICEINAQPQFGADAPEWIFRRMFKEQGRIPVVAVLGGPAQAAWISEVRSRMRAAGVCLGYADESGAWLGNDRIAGAQRHGVYQGCSLLIGESATQAILFVADTKLHQTGLPSDRFDALVVSGTVADTQAELLADHIAGRSQRVLRDLDEARLVGEVCAILQGKGPAQP